MSGAGGIAVVDGAGGNIASVRHALRRIGVESRTVSVAEDLAGCTGIILPGVGAFPAVMRRLQERGLAQAIRARVTDGLHVLGICAGMQVLADEGDEFGPSPGLGLIPGRVERLAGGPAQRLVHMGWNQVEPVPGSRLLPEPESRNFYFVHSFAMKPQDPADIAGLCHHGATFAAAVERGRIFGVQFHPEKSQYDGLMLLRRFVSAVNASRGRAAQREAERC